MSFWTEQRPMTGMQTCNAKKIACRFCKHAEKEHIGCWCCECYPDGHGKPDSVCFDNAPCPKFETGEDLLPYEIQI